MGVEYMLVDETNRRLYDLSKGPWNELKSLASSRSRPAFEAGICAVYRKYFGRDAQHAACLAAEIADFYERAGWEVSVLNDQNDLDDEIGMRGQGFEIAGSAIGGPARRKFLTRYWSGTLVR